MHRCGLPLAHADVAKTRAAWNGVGTGPSDRIGECAIAAECQVDLVGVPYSRAAVEVDAVFCQCTLDLRHWISGAVAGECHRHSSVADLPGTAGLDEVSVIGVLEDVVPCHFRGLASAA